MTANIDASNLAHHGELTLRVVPAPADVNVNGDVFGGWILARVDMAAGVAAMRHAKGRVATVAVNSVQFKQPVSVGDLLSIYTRIVRTGRTSMTVAVEVYAERGHETPVTVKVTEAQLTLVAIDHEGRKRLLPEVAAAQGS